MDITVQLNKLNGEIDAVNIEIKAEKAEWKNATTADKIDLLRPFNPRLERRIENSHR